VRVEDLEHALRRRRGLLQVGVDAAQFPRRPVHHEQHGDEGDELTGR
jgi:hypothetical protein